MHKVISGVGSPADQWVPPTRWMKRLTVARGSGYALGRIPAAVVVIALAVFGLTNPVPASATQVFPLPTTAPARSVAISLSSYSAKATLVTYTVTFVATGGMTRNFSAITLSGPSAMVFMPSGCGLYTMTDDTTFSGGCAGATTSGGSSQKGKAGGPSIRIVASANVSAGDAVTIVANGVTNPAAAGNFQLQLSTTSDPVVLKVPFTIVRESKVTSAAWSYTAPSSGKGMTEDISFVTRGGLAAHNSFITLAGPITFPTAGCAYALLDDSTPHFDACVTTTVASNGSSATVQPTFRIAPGDVVTIILKGASAKKSGSGSFSLSTSADPLRVTVRAGRSVSPATPSLTVTSSGARATDVTYAITFGVTRSVGAGRGTITISAPPGTILPPQGCSTGYVVTDDTTETSQGCVTFSGTQKSPDSAKLVEPLAFKAGDVVTLSVVASNSGSTGSHTLRLSTSFGVHASLPLKITTATTIQPVSLQLSTYSARATEVGYVLTFIPSQTVASNGGVVNIQFPSSVTPPSTSCAAGFGIADFDVGSINDCSLVQSANNHGTVTDTIRTPITLTRGDAVSVYMDGISNPRAPGTYKLQVSTSSDNKVLPVSFKISAATKVG